jgi:hypothetical protein
LVCQANKNTLKHNKNDIICAIFLTSSQEIVNGINNTTAFRPNQPSSRRKTDWKLRLNRIATGSELKVALPLAVPLAALAV